jgi:hypothetical protein
MQHWEDFEKKKPEEIWPRVLILLQLNNVISEVFSYLPTKTITKKSTQIQMAQFLP